GDEGGLLSVSEAGEGEEASAGPGSPELEPGPHLALVALGAEAGHRHEEAGELLVTDVALLERRTEEIGPGQHQALGGEEPIAHGPVEDRDLLDAAPHSLRECYLRSG